MASPRARGKWGEETDNSEDLTNAEVFTAVFDLLDVVLAENKKLLKREFERKPKAAKEI